MADIPQKYGQGPWHEITDPESVEAQRDVIGFTNPNLHRRKSDQIPEDITYTVSIYGLNSYRYIETETHDEDSRTSEVP